MHDPNLTRSHYTRTARTLARRRKRNEALRWLALWLLVALVGVSLALA
jgi:hypothetical protein